MRFTLSPHSTSGILLPRDNLATIRYYAKLQNLLIHAANGNRPEIDSSGPFGPDLDADSWLSMERAIRKYKRVFLIYRIFGNDGFLGGIRIPNRYLKRKYMGILSRLHLRDWYDTHAAKN